MILECSCGKMYRVKDDAANPPTKCPACGSPLKAHSGAGPASSIGADSKTKELEAKLKAAEKEMSSAKATADLKEKELREAQASISRLGSDLEKAQASYKEALRKKEHEVDEKQKRIAELEGEGTKVRQQSSAQAMSLLKQKDAALQEARERVTQLEEELASGGSKKGVPAEVESRLKELEAEVETGRESRAKLAEEMSKEKDAFRDSLKQKVQELEASEARATALEKKMVEIAGGDPKTPAEERARQRIGQLEKIVQDGEKRYRDLLSKVEEQGASAADVKALAAKDKELMEARSALHAEIARREGLEGRIAGLEKARASAPAARPEAGGTRLPADFETNLSTISASLQVLVDKVKGLQRDLNESTPAASAPAAESPAREGPYAPMEPAAEPQLEAPAELVDAAEEPEPAEEGVEEPVAEEKEDIAQLETLPLPDEEPAGLPQDETLLDMGGYKRRKPMKAPPEEAVESPVEDAPLSAEVSPGPLPEEGGESGSEGPKKKGFFGKLFGKKK